MPLNRCSTCDADLAASDSVCTRCGSPVHHAPESPPAVPIGHADTTTDVSETTPVEAHAPVSELQTPATPQDDGRIACPSCGSPVLPIQRFCGRCGGPIAAPTQQDAPPASAQQTGTAYGSAPPINPTWPQQDPTNDSGQRGGVPPEVARCRWHWGAFGMSSLWLLNHRMVPAGLALFVAYGAVANLPMWAPHASKSWQMFGFLAYLGIVSFLARHGHKLAWRNRLYEGGVAQFMATEGVWSRLGIMISSVFAFLCGLGVMSGYNSGRLVAQQRSSIMNLKQIGLALGQYAQDNDEMLPAMETPEQFKAALYPYVKSNPVFVQPGKDVPYSVNSALSHKSIADIPQQTEVAEETEASYDHKIARLYVDGTVHLEPEDGAATGSSPLADATNTEQNAPPPGTTLHKFEAGDTWTYDFNVIYSDGRKLVAKDVCTVVPVTVQNVHHLKMQQTISGKVGGIPVSVDESELFDQDAQGNYVAIGNYSGPGNSVKIYPKGDPHHGIVYPGTWTDDGSYSIVPGAIQVTLPDESSRACWRVTKRDGDGIDSSTYCPSIGSLVVEEGKSPKMRVVTKLRSFKLANGDKQ